MKCSKCGKEIKEGEKFCTECGSNVELNTNINNTTQKQNNIKQQQFFGCLLIIIVIIIGNHLKMSIFSSDNTTATSPVNESNKIGFAELTPVTINQNAFAPEVTQELSCEDLIFSLPSTYHYDTTEPNGNVMYITDCINDESFAFIINSTDSEADGKTFLEAMSFNQEELNYESISDIKSELLNGVIWYSISGQAKSNTSNVEGYFEYYSTNYNGKLYYVCFTIEVYNGKTIDISRSNQFYNIKNSLKFN